MEDSKIKAINATLSLERGIGAHPQHSCSCQISRLLLSTSSLRERIIAIGKALGLSDAVSMDETCFRYVQDALELHIKRLLHKSVLRTDQKSHFDPSCALYHTLQNAGVWM